VFLVQGDVIPAMTKKKDMEIWQDKLMEGSTYIMQNFKILKNKSQFRICDHPFKILFIGVTFVRPQPIANVPVKVFNLSIFLYYVLSNHVVSTTFTLLFTFEKKNNYKSTKHHESQSTKNNFLTC